MPSAGAQAASTTDYESYGYDDNGNVTSRRLRDGRSFGFGYDALNRMVSKIVPDGYAPIQRGACPAAAATRDVYYGYDLFGNMTSARFDSQAGMGVSSVRDALGRMTSTTTTMGGISRTLAYQFDIAGNRTRITHPDGVYFSYGYDVLNRMNYASWTYPGGTVPFMAISYDDLGRRTDINRASSYTGYSYDPASRLTGLNQRFADGRPVAQTTIAVGPSNQVVSETRDSDDYAYRNWSFVDRAYATNGLNQYTSAGPATFSYDANGNLISDGSVTYGYDAENRLVSTSGGRTSDLMYDLLGRLFQVVAPGSNGQALYDGDQLVGEYHDTTQLQRYAFGAGADEPVLSDEGAAMNCSTTRFLHTDRLGSVVASADCFGNRQSVNRYDEHGIPAVMNKGRFQYTGQAWLPEVGLYYYKARMYSPTLGRFLQTDPIGYGDGMNWYDYAGAIRLMRRIRVVCFVLTETQEVPEIALAKADMFSIRRTISPRRR